MSCHCASCRSALLELSITYGMSAQIEAKRTEKLASQTQSKAAECTFTPDLSLTKDVLEGHSIAVGTYVTAHLLMVLAVYCEAGLCL